MEPIVHPSGNIREYRLPVSLEEFVATDRAAVSTWYQRFCDKSTEEAKAMLADDWADCAPGLATRMRDAILSDFTPTSIAINEQMFQTPCYYPHLVLGRSDGRALLTTNPRDDSELAAVANTYQDDSLVDVFRHFPMTVTHTWSIDVGSDALCLDYRPACQTDLTLRDWNAAEEARYGDWLGSFSIYDLGTGDRLLLRRDQKVGFWAHDTAWAPDADDDDEADVRIAFDNLADCLDTFIAKRLSGANGDFEWWRTWGHPTR
ncbi:MAG: hypothetical protein KDB14_26320 [Planctomycetales bacterium]|nr:hypothetical protein [Planctomycetales bacterium]